MKDVKAAAPASCCLISPSSESLLTWRASSTSAAVGAHVAHNAVPAFFCQASSERKAWNGFNVSPGFSEGGGKGHSCQTETDCPVVMEMDLSSEFWLIVMKEYVKDETVR